MPSCRLSDLRPLYGFLDPHGGKAGRLTTKTSQSAIAIGGVDAEGRVFILDCWGERCHTDKLVSQLYHLTTKYSLRLLGAESNGLLNLWYDTLLREAKEKGKHLPLVPVPQVTTTQKDDRITDRLQPLVRAGKLLVRQGLEPLVTQIVQFPQSPQKDLIDAVASLVAFIPPKPRAAERHAEDREKQRYLQACGLSPELIKRYAGA